ncbi:MAG: phosphoribosylanthranilate isomerase [Nitrososphaerota archaeon]|jgi:phosphoribosylanthranilate isomerase|nr:phosphoribosylanthranilate isomerase [Nitrososphaerota archaeon]
MKLKICGLKTLHDVDCINQTDIDYAGFVFAPSRQQINIETAKALKNALNSNVKTVGVFVDESYSFIKKVVDEGIIDLVQFHGGSEYEMPCQTIRAFRMQTLKNIKPTKCNFVLFDSYKNGVHGSTGEKFDWQIVKGYTEKHFFLAGGIDITNIRHAMELNPYCVDISSGAEENGQKSLKKIIELAYECNR